MHRKVNVVEDLKGNKIVVMIVRHAEDEKMYLYDIMNIKKETSNLFQS